MPLRDAIAFLLPAPLEPDDIYVARSDPPTQDPTTVPAVLGHRRCDLRYFETSLRTQYAFLAVPRGSAYPRALIPLREIRTARRLLMPRSLQTSVGGRSLSAVVRGAPTLAFRLVGSPIFVACRQPSEIIHCLYEHVPGASIGGFFGNQHNAGRSTVFAFRHGHASAIVKIASGSARQQMDAEAHALTELSAVPALRGTVPRLLDRPAFHLGAALITDAFDGSPCPPVLDASLYNWLSRCVSTQMRPVLSSSLVTQLRPSLMPNDRLAAIVAKVRGVLNGCATRRTITHGDFAPWNILIHEGTPRVFDWEYGTLDGLPEWDALHFAVRVGLTLHGHNGERLADITEQQLRRGSAHYPDPESYRAVAALVLVDAALRHRPNDTVPFQSLLRAAETVGNC